MINLEDYQLSPRLKRINRLLLIFGPLITIYLVPYLLITWQCGFIETDTSSRSIFVMYNKTTGQFSFSEDTTSCENTKVVEEILGIGILEVALMNQAESQDLSLTIVYIVDLENLSAYLPNDKEDWDTCCVADKIDLVLAAHVTKIWDSSVGELDFFSDEKKIELVTDSVCKLQQTKPPAGVFQYIMIISSLELYG